MTVEYLKALWEGQGGRCALTGLKIELRQHESVHDIRTMASLDRIDSKLPYSVGNVQFVGASMNLAKQSMSNEEMMELIAAIRSGIDLC